MTQPSYNPAHEGMWWWKVALHLDEAQLALANAMAHNLDDQRPVFALQDKLREGQAILLEIFRAKRLLPGSTNGASPPAGGPLPTAPTAADAAPMVVIGDVESAQTPIAEEETEVAVVESGNGRSAAPDDAAAPVDPATPAEVPAAIPVEPDASV